MDDSDSSLDPTFLTCPSSPSAATAPFPPPAADVPILFCTLPDTPSPDTAGSNLGVSLAPMETVKERSPEKPSGIFPAVPSSQARPVPAPGKKRPRAFKKKSRALKINTEDSPPSKSGPAQDAAKVFDRLAISSGATLRACPGPHDTVAAVLPRPPTGTLRAAPTGSLDPGFPRNLEDVVNFFSKKPSQDLEGMDILEVAAMKGIHFAQPRWWRPGGYDN